MVFSRNPRLWASSPWSDGPLVWAAVRCRVGHGLHAVRGRFAASPAAAEFAERAQPVTCKCPDKLLPANRNHFMESSKALPIPPQGAAGAQVQQRGRGAGKVLNPRQRVRAAPAQIRVPWSVGAMWGCCCPAPRGAEAPAGLWQASGTGCRGSSTRWSQPARLQVALR